eukprot:4809135-Amphidinium_carterae.1
MVEKEKSHADEASKRPGNDLQPSGTQESGCPALTTHLMDTVWQYGAPNSPCWTGNATLTATDNPQSSRVAKQTGLRLHHTAPRADQHTEARRADMQRCMARSCD